MLSWLLCVSWFFLIVGYLSKEEKLPVLLEGPMLELITESSVVIRVNNFNYGVGEATPDHYLIQYKEKKRSDFKNYSIPQPYPVDLENKTITIDVIPREIRILLIANDQCSTTKIPKIIIGSLQRIVIETNNILLKWFPSNSGADYTVEYTCRQEYCNLSWNAKVTVNKDKYQINNLDPFSKCSIRLYDSTSKNEPVDVIKATTHKMDNVVFPTNFKFANNNSMIIYFDKCNYFTKPLTYSFELRCISKWCKNEHKIVLSVYKEGCKTSEIINTVELLPFTQYELTVNATQQNVTNSENYPPQTTPPTRPKQVQNLSIECRDKTAVWIKWQLSYPPTGIISEYYIGSETWHKTIKDTETFHCGPENSSICAEIKGEKISKIIVKVKNEDVAELGLSSEIEIPNVPQAPDNVTLKFIPPNKARLSWRHSFLKEFVIEVQEANNKKFNYSSSISNKCTQTAQTFQHEIQFKNTNSEYILNIRGLDVESEIATFNITLTSVSFSSNPLVQFCSKINCTLSVPKPENSTKVSIEVKEKLSNDTVWTIPEINLNQDVYISLEIGKKNATLLQNETNIMILRNENNNAYWLHLDKDKLIMIARSQLINSNIIIIITIIPIIISIIA